MVNLNNENYWTTIYEGSRLLNGKPARDNRLEPILINVPFLSNYFKVLVQNPQDKPSWWLAGSLLLFVGTIEYFTSFRYQSATIPLRQWQIVHFPLDEAQNWHLQFESAFWHQEITIEIQQYVETT